jgi:hypothetical protein
MLLNKEILIGIYRGGLKPKFSIVPNFSTIIEGETVTFTVNTTNVDEGTILYWTTLQITGTINSSDFTDNLLSDSVLINGNTGTITRTLVEDLVLEGTESFKLELRTDSVSGPIIAVSNTIVVVEPFKLEIDTALT